MRYLTSIERSSLILEAVYNHDEVELLELQKILRVSSQTLLKDIRSLNAQLDEIGDIYVHGTVVKLKVNDFYQMDQFLTLRKTELNYNYVDVRVAFIIKTLVLEKNYVLIDELAEEMSVSRSTVNNDLASARKKMDHYNVKIEGVTNKGLRLIGDELNIRLAYIHLASHYFPEPEIPEKILLQLEKVDIFNQLDFSTKKMFLSNLHLSVMRIQNGEEIQEKIGHYCDVVSLILDTSKIKNQVELAYDIQLSYSEMAYILFPLNLNSSILIDRDLGKYGIYSYSAELTLKIILEINRRYHLSLNYEIFHSFIKEHMVMMINRLIFRVNDYTILFDDIIEEFPFELELAKTSFDIISKDLNVPIPKHELGYLTLYYSLYIDSEVTVSRYSQKCVLIVMDSLGKSAVGLIKNQLINILDASIEFKEVYASELSKLDPNSYDVVVSLIPISGIDKKPLIRLNRIFDEEYIFKKVHTLKDGNSRFKYESISDLISLEKTISSQDNYLKIIEIEALRMQEERLVDSQYPLRIVKKERKSGLIFDNGIAIPHEINYLNDAIILRLIEVEQDVSYRDQSIYFIFLLAIPHKMSNELTEFLTYLYDKIFLFVQNQEKIDKLEFTYDEQDLYELLFE